MSDQEEVPTTRDNVSELVLILVYLIYFLRGGVHAEFSGGVKSAWMLLLMWLLMGVLFVLWRSTHQARALPHSSLGAAVQLDVVCPYHGLLERRESRIRDVFYGHGQRVDLCSVLCHRPCRDDAGPALHAALIFGRRTHQSCNRTSKRANSPRPRCTSLELAI